MDEGTVHQQLLARHGIRIDPEMSHYISRRLSDPPRLHGERTIPVIGIDALTGVPLRQNIDLDTLQPPTTA